MKRTTAKTMVELLQQYVGRQLPIPRAVLLDREVMQDLCRSHIEYARVLDKRLYKALHPKPGQKLNAETVCEQLHVWLMEVTGAQRFFMQMLQEQARLMETVKEQETNRSQQIFKKQPGKSPSKKRR